MRPPRAAPAMQRVFAALVCLAFVAKADVPDVEVSDISADAAWSKGASGADAGFSPGTDGRPLDIPESMKDIPMSPQNPAELARGLRRLKALLQDRDTATDPEVAEKLAMLTEKLKELGVEHILEDDKTPWAAQADQHIACLAMAAKTAGTGKTSTIDTMRRLARGKMTPELASETVLLRLVASCIDMITQEVADEFKKGKHKILPQDYVKATVDDEKAVIELDEDVWHSLRYAATQLIKKMDPAGEEEEEEEEEEEKEAKRETQKETPKTAGSERASSGGGDERKMPIYFGLLMAIPLLGIFGFLGKIFLSMSKDAKEKKAKKKEKKVR